MQMNLRRSRETARARRLLQGILACAVIVLATRSAAGQAECPVAAIGQICDSGTCLQATCRETVDGSTTVRDCGACVTLPANYCVDAGDPCGDGGIYNPASWSEGSGSRSGLSSSISFSLTVCEYASEAGAGGDGAAVRNGNDATAASSGGSGGCAESTPAARRAARSPGSDPR
jgi:hypothetical protein